MDNQSNRKKRRSRGDGVTSYRVTSSLSLSDAAYEHQQRTIQQPAQPAAVPYAEEGYESPQNNQGDMSQGYYAEGEEQGYTQEAAQEAPLIEYTEQDHKYDPYTDTQGFWGDDGEYHYYDATQDNMGYWGADEQYHYLEQDTSQQGGAEAESYYDENHNGGYDTNYDPNNYDPYAGGYDQPPEEAEIPKRKRKIESVRDHYADIMGEGLVSATDGEDSPHQVAPAPSLQRSQYLDPSQLPPGAQPPPHMTAPQSPLIQMLGPTYDIFMKLKSKWKFVNEKIGYYTDMIIDLQDSVQKEVKDAAGLAFKGLMNQLKQRSPLAVPYQNPAQPGMPAGEVPPGGDPNQGFSEMSTAPRFDPVSFVDLHELNVEFTDNYDQPLFDFAKYANSQYKVSKMIVDPTAMETAVWAIQECAARAGAIPPAQEGPYANIPLNEIMENITQEDLLAFLNYVKAFPGNYVSRNLKISETFATWVVYGAPTP